jgi:hypothetical protein
MNRFSLSGSQHFTVAFDSEYADRDMTDWLAGPLLCLSVMSVPQGKKASDKNDAGGD